MTSKEAIQELYNEREYLLGEKVHSKTKTWHNDITHYDNINHCLLTIREDLERLEELEKENERLKKAIDIFAKLIYLREHNKLKCLYTDECYYELLNEEYDLIIEVLENE